MKASSVVAITLLAVVAGCDSSDPVAPQVDVDAALTQTMTGAMAYGDFGMGFSPPAPAMHASDCSYDAPTGFFKCAPMNANGIVFIRQFQLLDASGAPLPSVNPLQVAAIRSVTDVNGTVSQGGADPFSFTIARHDDATLTGLQSTTRILNGTSTQQLDAGFEGTTLVMTDTTVTTNLQLPSSPDAKYPLGGTVVSSGTIKEGADAPGKYRVEVAFDGTSFVTIKTIFAGQTVTCRINMAAPDAPPSCT